MKTQEHDFLESARRRLIREMERIPHEDEAGRVLKDVVTSTATILPLLVPEFLPETHAAIYSRERMERLLTEFAHRLLQTQAEWANRWNDRRG